jgi:parallel beta-helix repeat protein
MKTLRHSIYDNSIRLVTLAALTLVSSLAAPHANANTIVVSTTIQAAVDATQPGDTLLVPPGTYRENVRVTKEGLTIKGSPGAVLDGAGLAGNTGIRVAPASQATRINGFTLSGLTIQNYSRNGVLLLRVDNFHISDGRYLGNHEYGIFPIFSSGGLIAANHVSGADDAGIYVGQSGDVMIEKNQASDCTIGIEIENSSMITVRKNMVERNSIGILVQVLPGLAVTVTADVLVSDNRLIANNRPNPVSDPDELLSLLPSGVGFFNVGGDRVMFRHNTAIQNQSAGIIMARIPSALAALDPRIDPFPDFNETRDNVAVQNGESPDPRIAPLPGSDLLWDFSGAGNCWASNIFKTSFPALPVCP